MNSDASKAPCMCTVRLRTMHRLHSMPCLTAGSPCFCRTDHGNPRLPPAAAGHLVITDGMTSEPAGRAWLPLAVLVLNLNVRVGCGSSQRCRCCCLLPATPDLCSRRIPVRVGSIGTCGASLPLPRSHAQPVGGGQRHHLHQRLGGRRFLCVWTLQLWQARPSEHDARGQASLQVLCPHHLCGLSASAPTCALPPARSRPRPPLPCPSPYLLSTIRKGCTLSLSLSAGTDLKYELEPPPGCCSLTEQPAWLSYLFVALLHTPHPPHLSLAHRPASVAARTRCCSCPHPSPPRPAYMHARDCFSVFDPAHWTIFSSANALVRNIFQCTPSLHQQPLSAATHE